MAINRIKDFVCHFESKFPVQHWQYEGVDLWPVFRILFYTECRDILISNKNNVSLDWRRKKDSKPKQTLFSRSIQYISKKLAKKIVPQNKPQVARKQSQHLQSTPVLFFGSWYFRTDFQGRYINRFFDPLINYLERKYGTKAPIVEYFGLKTYKDKLPFIKETLIDIGDYRDQNSNTTYNISREPMFVLFFKEFFQNVKIDDIEGIEKTMATKISNVLTYRSLYSAIFRDYSPKYAICQTFFNEQMFAMIIAARQAGVISIDLGHGYPNQPQNMVYSSLNKVPEQGYNSLPDMFWVWDETIKDIMDKGWVSQQSYHKVIVGGNPWLNLYQSTTEKKRISDKKILLYTMSINFPDQIIIEMMKNCSSEFEWWLRVHPALSGSISDLESSLSESGIRNYNLAKANSISLPEALTQCDIHLSNDSSSIYESIVLGNVPIIMDSKGTDSYRKYIEKGLAIDGANKEVEELKSTIHDLLRNNMNINKNTTTTKFKLYEDVVDQLMAQID